jgi:hypothetical protein
MIKQERRLRSPNQYLPILHRCGQWTGDFYRGGTSEDGEYCGDWVGGWGEECGG